MEAFELGVEEGFEDGVEEISLRCGVTLLQKSPPQICVYFDHTLLFKFL